MDEEKKKPKARRDKRSGDLFFFTSVRVKGETLKAIVALAARDGRSTSGYIRRIIEKHVERATEIGI